jgi:UDP-galactopyranose mutase
LKKILIVGAGPAGATAARVFAEHNFQVDLFDQRRHVAGNCFDEKDKHGQLLHVYGPHYFRTNSEELFQWLSQFTDWIPGDYFVRANVNGKDVPLPISLATLESLHGKKYSAAEFETYLNESRTIKPDVVAKNAEEQCLQLVGKELYEAIFKNYTIKQWGYHPRELRPEVTARIPLRFNHDERYPSESMQFMPKEGYTKMFQNILNHSNIGIHLNTLLSSEEIEEKSKNYQLTLYTGPIDTFFNYQFGKLEYRSLKFRWEHFANKPFYQSCVQMNYPNDHEFTRTVEIKHVTKQVLPGTTVCFEYSSSEGEPFYPMPLNKQEQLYQRYKTLAEASAQRKNHPIYFLGRLAEYKYYNMDHIFLKSLNWSNEMTKKLTMM